MRTRKRWYRAYYVQDPERSKMFLASNIREAKAVARKDSVGYLVTYPYTDLRVVWDKSIPTVYE